MRNCCCRPAVCMRIATRMRRRVHCRFSDPVAFTKMRLSGVLDHACAVVCLGPAAPDA